MAKYIRVYKKYAKKGSNNRSQNGPLANLRIGLLKRNPNNTQRPYLVGFGCFGVSI